VLEVSVKDNAIHVGERFYVLLERTLRVPDDGRSYPLPPGLGTFPVHRVEDHLDRVPAEWREAGGFFIPMYQREALWLAFGAAYWKPNAVKVAVGRINAVTGKLLSDRLHSRPQDYLVCPAQPWLDGIRAEEGSVRQFVAMPLGSGYTVEGQLTGREEFGGIQLVVYEPKPGKFPETEPPLPEWSEGLMLQESVQPEGMGLGAGGSIKQKIYPDKYGIDTWDTENRGTVVIHIANSEQYSEITGSAPPASPVSARDYTESGLPWFDLYDEHKGDLGPSPELGKVKTVKQKDVEAGAPPGEDEISVDIAPEQVKKLKPVDE
jgi:hypothetical protein